MTTQEEKGMAHKYRIDPRPHVNKDGTVSKTKKDHVVTHRGRGGRREVGVATSHKAAEALVEDDRSHLRFLHVVKNPHDLAYQKKHGIDLQGALNKIKEGAA